MFNGKREVRRIFCFLFITLGDSLLFEFTEVEAVESDASDPVLAIALVSEVVGDNCVCEVLVGDDLIRRASS
jgi:hypothetical protein